MNKRIKKKKAQYQCPKCGCKDGIVMHFTKGTTWKSLFVYCDSCNWEYKLKEKESC